MKQDISETYRPRLTTPRSVYIHVPFCRHRCGYCNFTLVAGKDHLIDRYLDALAKEIGWLEGQYEIDTLFFGGGTPSHLAPKQLERLSQIIRSKFTFTDTTEVTAECNPNDLTPDRADALQVCGVNRISLGVQSLNAEKLKVLERDHTPEQVIDAIDVAKSFADSVSIDMIFATPGESLEGWAADLHDALLMAPDHFSTYELTFEKGTTFWNRLQRKQLRQSDEDLRAEMYLATIEVLKANQYQQYEVSSFALRRHRCLHNLVYWSGKPFFAFGPGAARFVDGVRETNHRSTTRYLQLIENDESPLEESEKLEPEMQARELLTIGLRQIDGVSLSNFNQLTGYTVESLLGDLANKLHEHDLISIDDQKAKLTKKGLLVCDWIAGEILNA